MKLIALIMACAPMVHPGTMLHIVQAESSGNPWAIHVNGGIGSITHLEGKKAIKAAKKYMAMGYTVDIGLTQINSTNFDYLNMTVKEAFNPCQNIAGGAQILIQNYQRAQKKADSVPEALNMALSLYNTGDLHAGMENGYVKHVRTTKVSYKVPALREAVRKKNRKRKEKTTENAPSWDIFGDITNRHGHSEWRWVQQEQT